MDKPQKRIIRVEGLLADAVEKLRQDISAKTGIRVTFSAIGRTVVEAGVDKVRSMALGAAPRKARR